MPDPTLAPEDVWVSCDCGHVGPLQDLTRWDLIEGWAGECILCGNTKVITDQQLIQARDA